MILSRHNQLGTLPVSELLTSLSDDVKRAFFCAFIELERHLDELHRIRVGLENEERETYQENMAVIYQQLRSKRAKQ